MVTAIILTFLAVACRLCSAQFQVWNFVPMGAVALYCRCEPAAAVGLDRAGRGDGPLGLAARLWHESHVLHAESLVRLRDFADDYRARSGCQPAPDWSARAAGPRVDRIDAVLPGEQLWCVDRGTPLPADAVRTDRLLRRSDSSSMVRTILADLIGTGVLFGLGSLIARAVRAIEIHPARRGLHQLIRQRTAAQSNPLWRSLKASITLREGKPDWQRCW